MKITCFLTFLFISGHLFAQPDQRLARANQLFEKGDYRQAEAILNTFRPGNWHDKFNQYMILAEIAYSKREIEKFRQYTDTARMVVRTYRKSGIWMSLVYRNYSRYHHYNIVKQYALNYADSALYIFYAYKNQCRLIPVYSLYQAKASALRNELNGKDKVSAMFDSAFIWLNIQSHLSSYHEHSLNRSYGNFLLDYLTKCKVGTKDLDSVFSSTIRRYNRCAYILKEFYPKNNSELAAINSLLAVAYFHRQSYRISFLYLEKAIGELTAVANTNTSIPELLFTCINWQNSLAEKVLDTYQLIQYRKKYLDFVAQAEKGWIQWTFLHRSTYTGTFRLMYSNNLYSTFLANSYYLYKHTRERRYLELFFYALQRSKMHFFAENPDQVVKYIPDLKDLRVYVNDTTSYIDYVSTGMLYEQKGFIFVSTTAADTILEFGKDDFHYKFEMFSNTDSLFKSFNHFRDKSFEIYSQVFYPVQKILPRSVSNLVIAPSSGTALLNFDFFITDSLASDYRSAPYLFYRYNIRYIPCFGVEQVRMEKRGSIQTANKAYVFAPLYKQKLHNLPFLRKHARALKKSGFTIFNGSVNDREKFMQHFPECDLVEIAGHCEFYDDYYASDYRIILASDNHALSEIRVSDLLQLKSDCKLIVLALCETGQGELLRNDVSNHFSNYFIRSGVQSTVYSISKLDDRSAAFVLDRFYAYLNKGMTKDMALRTAKFDYLHTATSTAEFSPIFWAALVLQGDNSPIYPGSQGHTWQWYPYMFCAMLLLCLGIFISRWICR